MALRIGDTAPDFTAETTEGTIRFHDWVGDGWALFFSHPGNFKPVSATELGYVAKLKPEFDKRKVKIICLSGDSVDDLKAWGKEIEATQGASPNYPMIGDVDLTIAKLYDMLPAEAWGEAKDRTEADNAAVRNVYVIGPGKKVKLVIAYPMRTGRNFDEVLRVIDSVQVTNRHQVATPVNWKDGEDVIIIPAVSDEEAKQKYPDGWEAEIPSIRYVPDPE